MAMCPNCHTADKNFWAGQCHACNSEIGFIEQCIVSLIFFSVKAAATLGILWFLFVYL